MTSPRVGLPSERNRVLTALFSTSISDGTTVIRCALVGASKSLLSLDADQNNRPNFPNNLSCMLDCVYLGQVTAKAGTSYWIQLTPHAQGLLAPEKGFSPLRIGESILVQVRRESFYDSAEQGFKQPLLTRKISYAGAAYVYTPSLKEGGDAADCFRSRTSPALVDGQAEQDFLLKRHQSILNQTSRLNAPACLLAGPLVWERFLRDLPQVDSILVDDMALLPLVQVYCSQWRLDLVDKVGRFRGNLFEEYLLEDVYEDLFSPKVVFPGGSIFMEETSVGVNIDVNGSVDQRVDTKIINLTAAETIAHQLQYRSLSGPMILDFIDSGQGHRREIEAVLIQTLTESPIRYQILGWSKLGWLELMSEKRRTPLGQRLRKY